MSAPVPSGPVNATATRRGLVSTLAQSFAGIKTFVNAVILSAGLQLTGVLASSTNFLYVMTAAFTGSISSGNVQARLGGGNNSLAPQATFDLINSVGKAIALVAGTSSSRIVFDDSGPFYLLRTPRTNLDSGAPNTGTTAILTVDASGNVSANTGYLEAQKGFKVSGVVPGDTSLLSEIRSTYVGATLTGDSIFRHHHGYNANVAQTTFDLRNTATNGKAMGLVVGQTNARIFYDDSASFFVISKNTRAAIDAGTGGLVGINLITIATSTGDVTVSQGKLNTAFANTWNKAQRGAVTALTSSGGSIAVDLSNTNNYSHTLTENTTLAAPTNPVAGQSGCFVFTQHASSPKTLAFNSFWKFAGGTVPTLTATNGAVDVLTYYVCSSGFAVCNLVKGVA